MRAGLVFWIGAGACAALLFGSAASASAAQAPIVPPGFSLRATHGYRMTVLGAEDPDTGRGAVILSMRSRHAEAVYSVPASVTPTSIEADLGGLGRVDVSFVPSGRSRTERSECRGEPVRVESGRYEGTIVFEGEEGYSQVDAAFARGEAKMWLNLLCASGASEGAGARAPGARLTVRRRGGDRFEFRAMKNGPKRPAMFTASVSERRGELHVARSVNVRAAPRAFDFDLRSGRARVRPPAPFSGSASYRRRSRHSRPRWRGNLRVDLPGRSDVRLTGPGARAALVRAVFNPAHPF